MYDFIYKNDFICKNVYEMGMGEKKPIENAKTNKNKEKIPRLFAFSSPLLRYGGWSFSVVLEHRKLAGPTVSGSGS